MGFSPATEPIGMTNADIIVLTMANGGSVRDYHAPAPGIPDFDAIQNLQDMFVVKQRAAPVPPLTCKSYFGFFFVCSMCNTLALKI